MFTDHSEFDIIFDKQKTIHIETPLIGEFNIEDVSLAASIASIMEIDDEIIKDGIKSSNGAPGRMQRIPLSNGATGIVDYAHTPDALEKALLACKQVLESSGNKGRLICVFGCGGDRDKSKRPLMGNIATKIANYTIITNDNPRTEKEELIFQDILNGVSTDVNFELIPDRKIAIEKAYKLSRNNDLILVAGKGHESYQIIGTTRHFFDDVEEVKRFA